MRRERQRREHALLCGDQLNVGVKPAPQSIDRGGLSRQLPRKLAELIHLVAVNGLEQGLARREVAVERPNPDPGRPSDGLEAGVRSARAEHGRRGLEEALAIADRVGAGPPRCFCSMISHQRRSAILRAIKRR